MKKFNSLILSIEKIKSETDILNLCAEPTGYSWLGVKNASLSLFPNNTAEIPQNYSEKTLSDQQIRILGEKIGALKFDQIVFNGFNTYFLEIIHHILKVNPSCVIGYIHHGFFAEINSSPALVNIYNSIIEGIELGLIHKIGFLKRGNSAVFHKLFNTSQYEIININPVPIQGIQTRKSIGVLTNSSLRKNTLTQGVAALCCSEYDVVVSKKSTLDLFDKNHRLREIGKLEHNDFLREMAQNTINSHVTFSEASGGQVFTESLAMGVPCLTSLTHGYLDDNEYLQKALIVDRFDDAWAIYEKMCEVIDQRDVISEACLKHSYQMNIKAKELINKFLS